MQQVICGLCQINNHISYQDINCGLQKEQKVHEWCYYNTCVVLEAPAQETCLMALFIFMVVFHNDELDSMGVRSVKDLASVLEAG